MEISSHVHHSSVNTMKKILFLILAFLSFLPTLSKATSITRGPIGGYLFGVVYYADAKVLASKGCIGSSVLDHLEYTPRAGAAAPDVTIYCSTPQSNGTNFVHRWAGFSWSEVCATGIRRDLADGKIVCELTGAPIKEKPCQKCPLPQYGNPINIAKKEKLQVENDYKSASMLKFVRTYSSVWQKHDIEGMSFGWRHNYSKRIVTNFGAQPLYVAMYTPAAGGGYEPSSPNSAYFPYAQIVRSDGYIQYFQSNDLGDTWSADSDVNLKLEAVRNDAGRLVAWKVTTESNDVEWYGETGRLTSMKYASGITLSFSYSDAATLPSIAHAADLLIGITDSFGKKIALTYDDQNRVATMTTPAGKIYTYAYNALGMMESVTYPDGLRKYYHYNEPEYQLKSGVGNDGLLTGVSFERAPGDIARYAIFRYNASGQPVSTEHAGGVDKFKFNYVPTSYVTPLGVTVEQIYRSDRVSSGVHQLVQESKPSSTAAGLVYRTFNYDSNGNFLSNRDYNGNTTTYRFDAARNLELSRTEASGTSFARTITTEWSPTLRLPARIAEPCRITTFVYDATGLELTKTVQATSDLTGTQAFTAPLVGGARVWQSTYNGNGQLLTSKGPRTDVNDLTTYAYDQAGNLASITNALNQQISFANYDADGNVGTITDPNGAVTTLTYTLRGQLASKTVAGEYTNYSYDGADSLTQVVLPSGTTVTYSYDSALRLTGFSDSLGNSITYTLDAMGNRLSEQVKDPGGVLARQTTRVFDTLGQMKQQTGAAQ